MKLKTDLERLLPGLLTLYGWLGCLAILESISRSARNVALFIILVAGITALVVRWHEWMKPRVERQPADFLSWFVFMFCSQMTISGLNRWFHIPFYVQLIIAGVLLIPIVVMLVLNKLRNRTLRI